MRLPFVSREHYDYMRASLEKRVAEVDEERRNLLDYILRASVGTPLFDEVARETVELPPAGYMATPPNEQAEHQSPERRSARARIRSIQGQIDDEARSLIESTIDEGRKAAQ